MEKHSGPAALQIHKKMKAALWVSIDKLKIRKKKKKVGEGGEVRAKMRKQTQR